MHALIVAGPSGAGKSTFLKELYAGRLASDIRQHLPTEAHTWPLVYCHHPEQWQCFADGGAAGSRTAGLVAHHDITLHWRKHNQDLARDPFWQILQRCERVTLVVVRPSPRRLLIQWSLARLGMQPWKIRARQLLSVSAWRVLRSLRRLRSSPHPSHPDRKRYPRRLRFLKHVDRKLHSYRMRPTGHFDLYRRPRNVEQMLQSWNDMIAAKTASLPMTRIELVPDAKIGSAFSWHMQSLERMKEPSAALLSPLPAQV